VSRRAARWLGVALLVGARTAAAQPYAVTLTLANPTVARDDDFGLALAASGRNLLVGVPLDDTAGQDAGAAYFLDGGTGALVRTLVSPAPVPSGLFGRSVAVAGAQLVVGAPAEGTPQAAGVVHLFDGATGSFVRTLANPTPDPNDVFGFAVAAAAASVAVGAPLDAGGAGAVHVFDPSTGAFLRTLTSPGAAAGDEFGFAVAAIGSDLLVGAPFEAAGPAAAGAAYLFDGTTGAFLRRFTSPAPTANSNFGAAAAAFGANVLVGAPSDGGSGAAYLFDATTGTLLRTFRSPHAAAGDGFGTALAAVGGTVAIGVPYDDSAARDAGALFLFDGTTGALLQELPDPAGKAADFFGVSLAATGATVAAGAIGTDAGATDAGAAYLLDPCGCDPCHACVALAGCVAHVASDCRPAAPGKSTLSLHDSIAAKRRLAWSWRGAGTTTAADLGDPLRTTGYTLCLFDGAQDSPVVRFLAGVPAGGTCGGKPCWKASGRKGFRFRSKPPTAQGVSGLSLRAGRTARIVASAQGPGLALPALPFAPPVTVQLKASDGPCWDARFTRPRANKRGRFRAQSG